MGCVYLLTNIINKKKYVGKTQRKLSLRLAEHFKPYSNTCRVLKSAINKYGKDNFKIDVLFESDDIMELNNKEIELISKLNTLTPNGYNLTFGGEGMIPGEETRKLLSSYFKGKSRPHAKKPICGIHIITKEKIYFDSLLEAEKAGFKKRQINAAMRVDHGINCYKEYYWVFTKNLDSFIIPDIAQDRRLGKTFESKPVIVFNLKTNKMEYFKSIHSCVKIYKNKKYIRQCLNGKRSMYKDCIFSWKGIFNETSKL